MLRISGETDLKPQEVILQASKFFTQQYGLKIKKQSQERVEMEGGGGGVSIGASTSAKKTEVEIVTTEWEEPVKEFMRYLSKK
jgi:hypothetical protein